MRFVLLVALISVSVAFGRELSAAFDTDGSVIRHRVPRAPASETRAPSRSLTSRRPRDQNRDRGFRHRLVSRRRFRNVTASANALSERFFGASGYDPVARPISDDSKAVLVNFKFLLTGIRSLNPITHTLTATALMCSWWREPRMRWSKRFYGNVSSIRAAVGTVWTPDILGPSSRGSSVTTRISNALIDNQGNATLCVFGEIKTLCRLDLASFPYDEQLCRIILRPHELSSRLVNFVMPGVTDTQGVRYGEWHLYMIKGYTHFNYYGSIELGTVVLELRLKRSSDHYRWSVCIPTGSLLLVVLVSSWLPRRHIRARQGLLSGLLLANVLLLRHTSDLLEGAQSLPNILILQAFCLGLVTSNIISTSILQMLPSAKTDGAKGDGALDRFTALVRTAIARLDWFGYPIIGLLLILWTMFAV